MKKTNLRQTSLLTIGELSKFTGVSTQAIRHYEKIELLKPTFVDPETNYRYYSLQHPELVDYIILASEFDIPLKTLRDYFKNEDIVDLSSLVTYAKKQATAKINKLQQNFTALCQIESAIEEYSQFPVDEIYERSFPNQQFVGTTIDDVNEAKLKCLKLYEGMTFDIEETPDFGVMIKNLKGKIATFAVVEVSSHCKNFNLTTPAGTWICYKSYDASIDRVHDIFADYLTLNDDFIAIESEVISSKVHIEKPLLELRVLKIL